MRFQVRKAEKDFAQQQQLIADGAAEPDSKTNKRRSLFESFHYDVPKKPGDGSSPEKGGEEHEGKRRGSPKGREKK